MRALRGRVSGLCQPDYVLDIPGGAGKSPVARTISCHIILLSMKWKRSRGVKRSGKHAIVSPTIAADVHLYPPEP